MTKILFITTEFPPLPGGIGMHAWSLSKQLISHHYKTTVLTNARSNQSSEERNFDLEQPFTIVRVKRFKFLIFTYIKRYLVALKLLKSNDIVVCSGKFSLWLIHLFNLFYSKNTIAIVHGSELLLPSKKQQLWVDKALRKSTILIAVSNYTRSLLKDELKNKAIVINNGFELPIDVAKTHASSNLTLITVGNLTQRKGQHNIIACLPQLKEIFPEVTYHMVGIPTNQDVLIEQAKQTGVLSQIIIHGRVTEIMKVALLEESNLFMMLSEISSSGAVEGFGIAILEANALGLPAIGSKGSGIEDAIKDGYSGKLVNPNNTHEVVAAVQDIMQNYDVYSANAKKWARRFTWEIIGEQYIEVIKRIES